MSFTITTAFVRTIQRQCPHASDNKKSTRLRTTCIEDTITGESAFLDQLAPTAAVKRTQRHGDSPIVNSLHLRRRVTPFDWEWGDLIDQEDKVRTLIDASSNYAIAAGYAMNRAQDDEIINAYFRGRLYRQRRLDRRAVAGRRSAAAARQARRGCRRQFLGLWQRRRQCRHDDLESDRGESRTRSGRRRYEPAALHGVHGATGRQHAVGDRSDLERLQLGQGAGSGRDQYVRRL